MRRTYHSSDFPLARLVAAKAGRCISVVLPARNEELTVGATVGAIRRTLVEAVALVDEIIVVDDGSADGTAGAAASEGATVIPVAGVLPEYPTSGKGGAMWKGLHESSGDIVVFCDADISAFDPGFVVGLAGPLLAADDVMFVKGFYDRPLDGRPGEGGRVTELLARPALSVFLPGLADLAQPLSGECAGRRSALESVPFVDGYGVDVGLLADITRAFGDQALVQCDLGVRHHRNRPLADLGPQALAVLQTVLNRAGVADPGPWSTWLQRPDRDPVPVRFAELPPLVEVTSGRKTA